MSVNYPALEMQIERAWLELDKLPEEEHRTMYLSPYRRVVWVGRGSGIGRKPHGLVEIGTYTREVPLADFRGDVFHVLEQMREAA